MKNWIETNLLEDYFIHGNERPGHGLLTNLRLSPVFAIPKKAGKWRRIDHLSWPPGNSVNDGIEKHNFPANFKRLESEVRLRKVGNGAWLTKLDIKDAYRHILVNPRSWWLTGFQFQKEYFANPYLMFGVSAPGIFQRFATMTNWMVAWGVADWVIQIMYDILVIPDEKGPPTFHYAKPGDRVQQFLEEELGWTMNVKKKEYLGITLNTIQMTIPMWKNQRINEAH